MAKRPRNIHVRLPNYLFPRSKWRRDMHAVIHEQLESRGIEYTTKDKVEVQVRFYLQGKKLLILDLDNRVKDVLDALQGRMAGGKSRPALLPNDNQVYRIIAEKRVPPKNDAAWRGHLWIRRYEGRAGRSRPAHT